MDKNFFFEGLKNNRIIHRAYIGLTISIIMIMIQVIHSKLEMHVRS